MKRPPNAALALIGLTAAILLCVDARRSRNESCLRKAAGESDYDRHHPKLKKRKC